MAREEIRDNDERRPLGKETPVEEMGPVPGWLFLVYFGLIAWGLLYFLTNWKSGQLG